MNDNTRRILLAVDAWVNGGIQPHWINEDERHQLEIDLNMMRSKYQKGGRWTDGWIAAHTWLIQDAFRQQLAAQQSKEFDGQLFDIEALQSEIEQEKKNTDETFLRELEGLGKIARLEEQLAASQSTLQDAADLCDRQGAEIGAMRERIEELVPQCDAAYAPYREMVQTARAETDKVAVENYQLSERIKELEAERRWIPFTSRYPAEYQRVLCWDGHRFSSAIFGFLNNDIQQPYFEISTGGRAFPLFWMPLPAAPEQEGKHE
jgi:hypothetical protein